MNDRERNYIGKEDQDADKALKNLMEPKPIQPAIDPVIQHLLDALDEVDIPFSDMSGRQYTVEARIDKLVDEIKFLRSASST